MNTRPPPPVEMRSHFQLSIVHPQCTVNRIGLLLISSHTRPADGPIERAETFLLLRI